MNKEKVIGAVIGVGLAIAGAVFSLNVEAIKAEVCGAPSAQVK